MSAHECWWVPMASWCHDHDCFWALMSAYCSMAPSLWVFMANMSAHLESLTLSAAYFCPWVPMGAHEGPWLLMKSSHEKPWTLMSLGPWSNEYSWELNSRHEYGAMRLWVLISTHEHSRPHSTILISAFGCSLAYMRTYGSSWALTTGHECWNVSLNNKQKMLSFEMTSL